MKTTVTVTQCVHVEVDRKKFTKAWMAEFRRHFYPFHTIEDHIQHLAQLEARGVLRESFIEGYGPPEDMGIKVRVLHWETEV